MNTERAKLPCNTANVSFVRIKKSPENFFFMEVPHKFWMKLNKNNFCSEDKNTRKFSLR